MWIVQFIVNIWDKLSTFRFFSLRYRWYRSSYLEKCRIEYVTGFTFFFLLQKPQLGCILLFVLLRFIAFFQALTIAVTSKKIVVSRCYALYVFATHFILRRHKSISNFVKKMLIEYSIVELIYKKWKKKLFNETWLRLYLNLKSTVCRRFISRH